MLIGGGTVRLVEFRFHGIARPGLRPRELDQENRPVFGSVLDRYEAVMVVDDLADNGETQPGAVGLTCALINGSNRVPRIADGTPMPLSAIRTSNESSSEFPDVNGNLSPVGSGFAGVEQKIKESALNFLRIEDSMGIRRRLDGDRTVTEFRASQNGIHGVPGHRFQGMWLPNKACDVRARVRARNRARTRSSAPRRSCDLLENFVAIELQLIGFIEKFGIGNADSGEGVPQVVRNRTGGPPQSSDLFGLDLPAL